MLPGLPIAVGEALNYCLEVLDFSRLVGPSAVVAQALTAGRGVRLGQSAVLSTKVHAFNAHSPEHVQIMTNADAGQVFYRRIDTGEVCHLDVFHQCGLVDHKLVARYVRRAVKFYQQMPEVQPDSQIISLELIDIQTAGGGGRITGALSSGKKRSLRRVHENHVHVALSLPLEHTMCLFYIVAAIEAAIVNAGLELRCNEQISYIAAADSPANLSPYTDQTDSLLTGQMHQIKRD
ncbi:MAG: hypothetical protein ACRDBM_08205 [Sporomusa sp.]